MQSIMMQIRFLSPGEEKKWYDLVDEEGFEFFTQLPNYRMESHLVIEECGKLIGGMEIIIDEPDMAILFNPIIQKRDSSIIKELLTHGLKVAGSLNIQKTLSLINGRNAQLESMQEVLSNLEFSLELNKILYKREPLPIHRQNLTCQFDYKSLSEVGEPSFIELFGMIYQPDVFETNPQKCFQGLTRGAVRTERFYPEDWELAYLGETAVGLTMPQLHDEQGEYGSNFYLGVVPKIRGKGVGLALQQRAVETLIRRGAKVILGSTDIKNMPMIKIFESLGYEIEDYQYFYEHRKDK